MRDPERIHRICEKLSILWSYYPDQRLGQFLENYMYGCPRLSEGCIFNTEDDIIEEKLDEAIKQHKDIWREMND